MIRPVRYVMLVATLRANGMLVSDVIRRPPFMLRSFAIPWRSPMVQFVGRHVSRAPRLMRYSRLVIWRASKIYRRPNEVG